MKIYTQTGDEGKTSLYGGDRVPKTEKRLEVYGTLDELNSLLGIVLSYAIDEELSYQFTKIQSDLFVLGAELATPAHLLHTPKFAAQKRLSKAEVESLESWIDAHQEHLEPLKAFVLPGGSLLAAQTHLARTVCRRAERHIVSLHQKEPQRAAVLAYLNRLSDYLFVAARRLNQLEGKKETQWNP